MLSVEQFRNELAVAGADFIIDAQTSDQQCRMRFEGVFNQQPVIWHAHLETLGHYAAHHDQSHLQQFIEIKIEKSVHCVHIGLNVDRIDKATLLRTIIMIRKYKRLYLGRHNYGEWVDF